jgi:predicted phage tail protein
MRVIGTKTHGYLDYIVGLLLIVAPWVLGFAAGGIETWLPVILGAGTILYSLLTDYELGVWRMISMRTHLILDIISGLLLLVSPWLFGFADYIWAPHFFVGLFEIGVAMMTEKTPHVERRDVHRARPIH